MIFVECLRLLEKVATSLLILRSNNFSLPEKVSKMLCLLKSCEVADFWILGCAAGINVIVWTKGVVCVRVERSPAGTIAARTAFTCSMEGNHTRLVDSCIFCRLRTLASNLSTIEGGSAAVGSGKIIKGRDGQV